MPKLQKEEKFRAEEQTFFAAANSGKGFVSFYNEIFNSEKIKRRYLIKGGPGTGKSTLMRSIADMAEEVGIKVLYYRCSSDPMSLDGIILNESVAVIDSTAPHSVEAELSGARDVIIDLGFFWNADRLYLEREKIKALTEQKKHSYALAYRFLSSAMQSDTASRELVVPYVDKRRIARIGKRLTREIESDGGYECRVGLSRAIGMSGRCALESYITLAKKIFYIEDCYGIAYILLCEICEVARQKGCRIAISYDPLTPDIPDSVFFEESKILFVASNEKQKGKISLRRTVDFSGLSVDKKRAVKAKSRNARQLSKALVDAATDELKDAADAHFELEKIYKAHMNFEALNEYAKKIKAQIVDFAAR